MKKTPIIVSTLAVGLIVGMLTAPSFVNANDDNMRPNKAQRQGMMSEFHENVDRNVVKLDNGLQINMTSDDSEIVADMHARHDMMQLRDSISHNIEKTDNGIIMTITSNDPDAVTLIQSQKHPQSQRENDNVTVSQEMLDNGVKVTISTDDPDMLEIIQNRQPGKMDGRKGGGFGGHKLGEFKQR